MHLGTTWRLKTINLGPKNLHFFLTLAEGQCSVFSKRLKKKTTHFEIKSGTFCC